MPLPSVSRVYANVNSDKPSLYSDYQAMELSWGRADSYEVYRKLGRGKFSEVFMGRNVHNNRTCVMKILKPIRKQRLQREISVLKNLYSGPNIVRLVDAVRDPQTMVVGLIYEHGGDTDLREVLSIISDYDKKYYMYQLLVLTLVDWGLAEYYHPNKEYHTSVASRYYKSPELLVDFYQYDYSMDMWSYGCVLAAVTLQKDPFFVGDDNEHQMKQIVDVLGWAKFKAYMDKYQIEIAESFKNRLVGLLGRPWISYLHTTNSNTATSEAIHLLRKVLVYDHQTRLSAREAMAHSYF
eukprot:Ihof_evm1s603 gene=Ihof_evmTU1s603